MAIRNIHRNFNNTDTPTNIYRMVDGDMKQIQRVYKVINGEPVIVWDLGANEYLEVSEYSKGSKYLERYYTRNIYTTVYWVHEVDGETVKTYLSTSEFTSWECDTLEAHYYNYGSQNYVDYYILPPHTSFGEHDMKITYKSPDTGNLLEVEYPIYHLENVTFNLSRTTYDWYPFRYLWAETSSNNTRGLVCPSGTLHYQCYDKLNNLIEDNETTYLNITYTSYTFPTPSNARYKFGDGQTVGFAHTPDSGKVWTGTITVNIRPYTDSRNTSHDSVYHRNVTPFTLGIRIENSAYENTTCGSLNSMQLEKVNTSSITDGGEISLPTYKNSTSSSEYHFYTYRNVPCINPVLKKSTKVYDGNGGHNEVEIASAEFFTSQDSFLKYLSGCTYLDSQKNAQHEILYGDTKTVILDKVFGQYETTGRKANIYGNVSALEGDSYNRYSKVSTIGYVYWGDGTFDIYTFNDKCMSYGSIISTVSSATAYYDDTHSRTCYNIYNNSTLSTLACGRTCKDETMTIDYEDTPMVAKWHEYTSSGDYDMVVTCSACAYDVSTAVTNVISMPFYNYFDDAYQNTLGYDYISVGNDLKGKWYTRNLAYTNTSTLKEFATNRYRYYKNSLGVYTFPEGTVGGEILATSKSLKVSNYHRPTRQITWLSPYGSDYSVRGIVPSSILTKFKVGQSLVFRRHNGDTFAIQNYQLYLEFYAHSRFEETLEIDLKKMYRININDMESLVGIKCNFNYADYSWADKDYSWSGTYTECYFAPQDADLIEDEEKHAEEYGISMEPVLLLEHYSIPPSPPSTGINLLEEVYVHEDDDGNYSPAYRYILGERGNNLVTFNDTSVTFTECFNWDDGNFHTT